MFTIYGHGNHLVHVTQIEQTNFDSVLEKLLEIVDNGQQMDAGAWVLVVFCFVCVEVVCPRQQFFSLVQTEPLLPGYYQYFWGIKYLAQEHNTAG